MTPSPDSRDAVERRLDVLERRQDDRHRENQQALHDIENRLDPMAAIVGDSNYRGRMRIAEDNIAEIRTAVEGLKAAYAKWSGAIIAVVGLITILEKLFLK